MATRHLSCPEAENVAMPLPNKCEQVNQQKHRNILGDIKNNAIVYDELVSKIEKVSLVPKCKTHKPECANTVKNSAIAKSSPKSKNANPGCLPESKDNPGEAFSTSLLPVEACDIDANDGDNPQLLSEYVNDIYDYLRELESRYKVRADYLRGQPDITPRMRSILTDWMVQVHLKFRFLPETLYLAINMLDRFLQQVVVNRSKLQLVGITVLFTACKYEEIFPPSVSEFVEVTDNSYTKEEVFKMERVILKTLDFNISGPSVLGFIRRNSKAASASAKVHMLSKYLGELCLIEYEMCSYKPSEIAAACTYLSLKLLIGGQALWTPTLRHYTKFTENQILPVVEKVHSIVKKVPMSKYQAVRMKYSSSKYMRISLLPVLPIDVK